MGFVFCVMLGPQFDLVKQRVFAPSGPRGPARGREMSFTRVALNGIIGFYKVIWMLAWVKSSRKCYTVEQFSFRIVNSITFWEHFSILLNIGKRGKSNGFRMVRSQSTSRNASSAIQVTKIEARIINSVMDFEDFSWSPAQFCSTV